MTAETNGGEKPLALTMGEPAGVGAEIALKAWQGRNGDTPFFFLLDDPPRLRRLAEHLGLEISIRDIDSPAQAASVFFSCLPVLPHPLATDPVAGQPNPANANAVQGAIKTAVRLVLSGEVGAVVTNPIDKRCLHAAGFPFPGHTEFLAALSGTNSRALMMLVNPELRVVPVTVHLGLDQAIKKLSTRHIVETATVVEASLKRDFGIPKPRLAVAGLNPHAGEGGIMGGEEGAIIEPAVALLRQQGIDVFGPLSPDALFTVPARRRYDAAICMYHDQALIPVKAIGFDETVNVTLGLPFVRTSPGHGTALDIAGTGQANAASLVAALNMAAAMARRRHAGNS
ncbi:MAG TPA: 4-hydroxythreonine-4-phosphate dehydrogenase PdxA [Rhodospirillales bacterium]|jgi:4-hydroxythreonine-4-phosphate dehydrogenase|nr:4-hydroxythreonine-4-phosphate dehydrogenase PdxA [Rhodospirillaceae bacterium]HJN23104.1 4-hydroxythreonine-4-phosphate dehydrogenase PdxA [Rhodospirillales bacterium]